MSCDVSQASCPTLAPSSGGIQITADSFLASIAQVETLCAPSTAVFKSVMHFWKNVIINGGDLRGLAWEADCPRAMTQAPSLDFNDSMIIALEA